MNKFNAALGVKLALVPLLLVFSPIIAIPILCFVITLSLGAGAQQLLNGMPTWALLVALFGFTSITVASIRAKEPGLFFGALTLCIIVTLQIGLGSFMEVSQKAVSADTPVQVVRMAHFVDQVTGAFPWMIVALLAIGGLLACAWLYDDLRQRASATKA